MDTTEEIAQLYERMGYIVAAVIGRTIELEKPLRGEWTDRELDTLYDEAGMYDSVRVSLIDYEPSVAQIEVGV